MSSNVSETQVRYKRLSFLGFPKYRVGTDGSIWRKYQWKGHSLLPWWKKLKPQLARGGYRKVLLYSGSRAKVATYRVHRLVLLAFVGPKPAGHQARHFPDRDPTNNQLSNLQWSTPKVNHADKHTHGTMAKGSRNAKWRDDLTEARILAVLSQCKSLTATADRLNTDRHTLAGRLASFGYKIVKRRLTGKFEWGWETTVKKRGTYEH